MKLNALHIAAILLVIGLLLNGMGLVDALQPELEVPSDLQRGFLIEKKYGE